MKSSGPSVVPLSLRLLISCLMKERTKSQEYNAFWAGPGTYSVVHLKISEICGVSIQHKCGKLHNMSKAIIEIQHGHFQC